MTIRIVASHLLALLAVPAIAAPPALEAFAREDIADAVVSPDGHYLALLATVEGRPMVGVRELGNTAAMVPVMVVDTTSAFHLTWCRWANARRLLCGSEGTTQTGTTLRVTARISAVDADGKNFRILASELEYRRGGIPFDGRIFDRLPDDATSVFLRTSFLQGSGKEEPLYVHKVNLDTNDRTQVMTIFEEKLWNLYSDGAGHFTLADGPGDHSDGYITNVTGSRLHMGPGVQFALYVFLDDKWQRLEKASAFHKDNPLTELGVANGRGYAYALANGRRALWQIDLKDASPPAVGFSHAQADVNDVAFDGKGQLIGAFFDTDRPHVNYFDRQIATMMRSIDTALPGTFNYVRSISDDRRLAVVASRSDVEAGRFYLFDSTSKKLSTLGSVHPELKSDQLTAVKAIEYPAQDGATIPGYLTAPASTPPGRLPLILLPHDGYGGRSTWSFDMLGQFLASRGYAVLAPNYRGSGGYGKAWRDAATQDWAGGLAYSDIVDATRWAIAQGIADPARICIIGHGNGGYLALLGAIRNADLFRCAVSINGRSDLESLARDLRLQGLAARTIEREVGSDDKAGKLRSPLRDARAVGVPVLLIHGTRATSAPFEQGERMAKALARANKAHKFVPLDNADDSLWRESERTTVLREVEAFLLTSAGT